MIQQPHLPLHCTHIDEQMFLNHQECLSPSNPNHCVRPLAQTPKCSLTDTLFSLSSTAFNSHWASLNNGTHLP